MGWDREQFISLQAALLLLVPGHRFPPFSPWSLFTSIMFWLFIAISLLCFGSWTTYWKFLPFNSWLPGFTANCLDHPPPPPPEPFPQLRALDLSFLTLFHWPLSFHFHSWEQLSFPLSFVSFWIANRDCFESCAVRLVEAKIMLCVTGNTGNLTENEINLVFRRLNEGQWEDVLTSFGKVKKNDNIENWSLWAYRYLLNPLTELSGWKVFSVLSHCTHEVRNKFPFVIIACYISTMMRDDFPIPPLSAEFVTQEHKQFKMGREHIEETNNS